jgi:hypothetical protein
MSWLLKRRTIRLRTWKPALLTFSLLTKSGIIGGRQQEPALGQVIILRCLSTPGAFAPGYLQAGNAAYALRHFQAHTQIAKLTLFTLLGSPALHSKPPSRAMER